MTASTKRFIDMLPGLFRAADEEWWKAHAPEDAASVIDGNDKEKEWHGPLMNYLSIFEKIIVGLEDTVTFNELPQRSIGQAIDKLPSYFNPETAPAGFLDWLSSWVALVLKEDWEDARKRTVIARIIPLYRMRGTRKGLEEYLNIYTHGGVTVHDNVGLFQVGINSQVGITTAIDLTDFFIVRVRLAESEQTMDAIDSKKLMIEAIIEREKPVHTRYKLIWENIPSLQVELRSQIEINTMLWSNE